jgi:hypothetical protein
MLHNVLPFFRTAVLFLVLLGTPAQAESDTHGSPEHCGQFGLFVSVVETVDLLIKTSGQSLPNYIATLDALTTVLRPNHLQRSLDFAGHSDRSATAKFYLADLENYFRIRQTQDTIFTTWARSKAGFLDRHANLLDLLGNLCGTKQPQQDYASDDAALNTPASSSQPAAGLGTGIGTLRSGPITQIATMTGYSIHGETYLLAQVFALLAASFVVLYIINQLLKLMHAIRLDRYSCSIPARAIFDDIEVLGRIDVLGNRGLSFEVADPHNPLHATTFTIDRRVKFLADTIPLHAVLTKTFDGSAGFRLNSQTPKPKLRQLLAMSTIKPHRKIEMGRKKKPAKPDQVSLVLNSHRTPAE